MEQTNQAPDWIAVLGTAQYDGVASRVLAARIATAIHLAAEYPLARIITLGGNLPGDRFTEAGVAARDIRRGGIASARITALAEGNDTAGSLAALARYVADHGLGAGLIVTDPLHRPRTAALARRIGLPARTRGAAACPQRFPFLAWWRAAAHEIGGLAVLGAEVTVGKQRAYQLRGALHGIENRLRPSRAKRNQFLRADEPTARARGRCLDWQGDL